MNRDAKALLAKINKGKVATSLDGKDYNTLYVSYFKSMISAGFGEKLQIPSGKATINDDQDWNKLFSTYKKHSGCGKSPILWLFCSGVQGISQVYDINGDGKLEDTPISQLNSFKSMIDVENAYSIEAMNTGIFGTTSYIISRYSN